MLQIWAEVWVIADVACRTLGFMRVCGPSKADGVSAMVRFAGVGQPARQFIRCAMP
jgi:hypothetical protein